MKKVYFVTTPLLSGHAVRGVGFYVKRILPHLKNLSGNFDMEIVDDLKSCDLVHYPFFDLFSHTLPIHKKHKTVVTIHDVIPLEFSDHYPPGIRGSFNFQLQKLALSRVERVITDSNYSAGKISQYLNIPKSDIRVIYLAADTQFKKVSRPQTKFKLPRKFVLYVGDVNYNKNIPNLVKACQKINIPLVMVGKQVTELERLDLEHPELHHLKNINWADIIRLGFVSDDELVNIYNLATVYCQPSFSEGSALPILEAMACGIPVSCSDIPIFHEHATESVDYFDPNNVTSIAKSLSNHQSTKPSTLNWAQTARQTLGIYREILDNT